MNDPVARLECEIVAVPWGCGPNDATWAARTIVLFDDACLTPNTVWEEVNKSFVVKYLKSMIASNKYQLQHHLETEFVILRDTREHRQVVMNNQYELRYLKHTYRFTAAEVSRKKKEIPVEDIPDASHVPPTRMAKQLSILAQFGITSEDEIPSGYEMFTLCTEDAYTGFLMVKKESREIGPLKAMDMNSVWILLYLLVRLRLCDDSQCLIVCLSLLDEEIRQEIIRQNGSFLFSITLASLNSADSEIPEESPAC